LEQTNYYKLKTTPKYNQPNPFPSVPPFERMTGKTIKANKIGPYFK
jgi:hypothetical protein